MITTVEGAQRSARCCSHITIVPVLLPLLLLLLLQCALKQACTLLTTHN
jgi:hypothetical protein